MAPLVIFDCDGVLVDSELLEHGVDAELLGPLGYAASPQELLQRFVGIARTDMYEAVFAELGREMPRGLLDEREKRVWQRCHSDLRTVPGVEEALEALRRRPKCVASSSIPAKLQLKLESTGLARHFAPYVFSTALVARGKPAPDIYLHAAQAVGHAANDCIVVEDSPHGIAGAKAAGMRAIGFTGGSPMPRRRLPSNCDWPVPSWWSTIWMICRRRSKAWLSKCPVRVTPEARRAFPAWRTPTDV